MGWELKVLPEDENSIIQMKEIFVVEDDADIRELLEYLLESENYKVQSFPTAESFNNQIKSHWPDLIILDIMLPDGNGVTICEEIKAEEKSSSIPVILMSAHIDTSRFRKSSADDFIAKPFDIEDLSQRIKRQLNKV